MTIALFVGGTLAFAVFLYASCRIAERASGERVGAWAWGLLGPVGWIIAAVRGVQVRMDSAAREQREKPPRG